MSNENNCPVCRTPEEGNNCPRCGSFSLAPSERVRTSAQSWKNLERAILSYRIRRSVIAYETEFKKAVREDANIADCAFPSFSLNDFKSILKEHKSLPKAKEQLDNLIRYLGDNLETPRESRKVSALELVSIIGALDLNGLLYILLYAESCNLIEGSHLQYFQRLKDVGGLIDRHILIMFLTFEGWEYYEKLKTQGSDSKKAFMAMSFTEDKELMKGLYKGLKKAVVETGFQLKKVDEEPVAGSIPERMKEEILNSKFVIADLTHHNNGAYWEAGYAEGLDKKVIYTCRQDIIDEKKTHFDTRHLMTVGWEEGNMEKFYREVKSVIRSTFRGESIREDEKITEAA